MLGVQSSNDPERYLGLPNMVGRRKKEAFQNLKDRFKKRIDNWCIQHLSQGRKEVFIKAVLHAILTYTMACFLLPKSLCTELESLIAKFWWQKGQGKRGIHWCEWKKLCIAKEQGGLGFRNLDHFNVALLAKQGWQLFNYPNSLLAQVLKAKYFPHSDFIHAQLGNSPSLTWKSVWAAKGLLNDGLGWRIGRGDQVSVWNDHWIPGADNIQSSNCNNNTDIELVSSLIDPTTRKWKAELIKHTFPESIAQKILQIPLVEEIHEDFQVWYGEHSDEFTVRSAYKLLQDASLVPRDYLLQTDTKSFYKKLWNLQLPSKILITIWRLSWNFIPTRQALRLRRLISDSSCPWCRNAEENCIHIFRQCPTALETWQNLNLLWVTQTAETDLWAWLTWVFTIGSGTQCRLFCCAIWMIWSSRNKLVHEGKTTSWAELANKVHLYITEINGSTEKSVALRDSRRQDLTSSKKEATIYFDASFDSRSARSVSGLVVRGSLTTVIRGDSKTVIKKCNTKDVDKLVLGAIIRDIKRKRKLFKESWFQFVPRSENKPAHDIATRALKMREETYLEEESFIRLRNRREERWNCIPD
ncbi:reverse transcriptase [Gossypium australe]|uniref:Reverse transcriptase n=1 Tax=Gossypium australe TaxID=47621 RepID=A0A5B6UZE5_9ROSI|nr:reverse transcriptase [Gossypium australe]